MPARIRRGEEEASGPITTAGMRPQRPNVLAIAIAVFTASALIVLFLLDRPGENADAFVEGSLSAAQASSASATPAMTATATATNTPHSTAIATVPPPTEPPPPPVAAPQNQPSPAPEPRIAIDANFAAQVLALANTERAARGLPLLASLGVLSQAAEGYSGTLLQLDSISHDAGGTSLSGRVQAAGYSGWALLGEALWASRGYLPPERVIADWLASPGHRDILLDGRFTKAGVGCAFRQDATVEARCVMVLAV